MSLIHGEELLSHNVCATLTRGVKKSDLILFIVFGNNSEPPYQRFERPQVTQIDWPVSAKCGAITSQWSKFSNCSRDCSVGMAQLYMGYIDL